MSYTLSKDQAEALRRIGIWYKNQTSDYLTLGGYAGTGKTTLIAYLRQAITQYDEDIRVAFCAYTGKAARVLADRLKEQRVARRRDSISTIHALIYTSLTDGSGRLTGWQRKDNLERDLIIVDEASMIDEAIWRDLLSFGIPVLAVGDHGQLPPINSAFNLMASPELRLETIYRQAETSPIIHVATLARTTGQIPVGDYGQGVVKLARSEAETGQAVGEILENWTPELLVLCGYNHTRLKLNQAIRGHRGAESPEPSGGDYVVALRNDRTAGLYNGMTGQIQRLYPASGDPDQLWYEATIELDNDRPHTGFIYRPQFGELESARDVPLAPDGKPGGLFDFGYALTVHKAQGSQSDRVLLFEERFSRMNDDDWRRWLYTAVTRAARELVIVGA
jgi:ATP-dependent exoDNAse (exonuclease V) alpha subunit